MPGQRDDAIRVAVRARPRLGAELASPAVLACSGVEVQLAMEYAAHTFKVDETFDEASGQEVIWESVGAPAVSAALEGYNAAILAYGQTGAGKTFTMVGQPGSEGIIPRAAADVFDRIGRDRSGHEYCIRASFLQIYNEQISDLLRPERTGLPIREDKQRGLYVEGLSDVVVRSTLEVLALLQRGHAARATAATQANELSSRSHAVFVLTISRGSGSSSGGGDAAAGGGVVARLRLVDLAGSESARGGVSGQRLEECKKINQSLSALGNVIHALGRAPSAVDARGGLHSRAEHHSPASRGAAPPASLAGLGTAGLGAAAFGHAASHVPYRDSKLTRLLQDAVGGNSVSTLVACVSTAAAAAAETLSTLKFAARARRVRNHARVNDDERDAASVTLRRYERELTDLRSQLKLYQASGGGSGGIGPPPPHPPLSEISISDGAPLSASSAEILISDGAPSSASSAQAERVHELLRKQREIILALTARCCERDAAVLSLQRELTASRAKQEGFHERLLLLQASAHVDGCGGADAGTNAGTDAGTDAGSGGGSLAGLSSTESDLKASSLSSLSSKEPTGGVSAALGSANASERSGSVSPSELSSRSFSDGAGGGGGGGSLQQLTSLERANASLRARLAASEELAARRTEELGQLRGHVEAARGADEERRELRRRMAHQTREREAMASILEHRVGSGLGRAAASMRAQQWPSAQLEIEQLAELVSRSVAALRTESRR